GVARIEVGMPAVSSEVAAGCAAVAELGLESELVGFARAIPGDVEACATAGLTSVIVEHTVNPYLCKYVYDVDRAELVSRLAESFAAARELGLRPIFMGWDFFRCTLDYCLDLFVEVVERCDPASLVLVDTFGVATPSAVRTAFEAFADRFGDLPLEFHNHDDFGLAVGSAVAAVEGGARVVHTSVNGVGERTGNAPTEQVVAALEMLLGVDTGVRLERLTAVSRLVEQVSKEEVPPSAPIVGRRVFQIETGVAIHSTEKLRAAGIKPVRTFVPSVVGQSDIGILLGAGSGTAAVVHHLGRLGIEFARAGRCRPDGVRRAARRPDPRARRGRAEPERAEDVRRARLPCRREHGGGRERSGRPARPRRPGRVGRARRDDERAADGDARPADGGLAAGRSGGRRRGGGVGRARNELRSLAPAQALSRQDSGVAETREEQRPPPSPRGSTPPQPPRFRIGRWWLLFFLGLLAVNFFISNRATEPASRVRIPYSPFFLSQI